MVKNLPFNAGDVSSIPGPGTRIPHAVEQLSLCASNRGQVLWSVNTTSREEMGATLKSPACHN